MYVRGQSHKVIIISPQLSFGLVIQERSETSLTVNLHGEGLQKLVRKWV